MPVPDGSKHAQSPEGPDGSKDPQNSEDSSIKCSNVLYYQWDEEVHKTSHHNSKV